VGVCKQAWPTHFEHMDFKEKRLYHQIHPLKLATDIGVVLPALYFLWDHRIVPAAMTTFVPPVLVSAAMMKWTPDLERLKRSALGAVRPSPHDAGCRSCAPSVPHPNGIRWLGP